jgi:hypothetical protein
VRRRHDRHPAVAVLDCAFRSIVITDSTRS